MSVSRKVFSWCVLPMLCCFAIGGAALAVGPTSVDPLVWQNAGGLLSFEPGHPTWVASWGDSSGHGKHLLHGYWAGNPLYKPNT